MNRIDIGKTMGWGEKSGKKKKKKKKKKKREKFPRKSPDERGGNQKEQREWGFKSDRVRMAANLRKDPTRRNSSKNRSHTWN